MFQQRMSTESRQVILVFQVLLNVNASHHDDNHDATLRDTDDNDHDDSAKATRITVQMGSLTISFSQF